MSEIGVDCDASATLCDRALEVVAKRGWLSKHSWSVSKTVHAFAKPIRVMLAAETPADVVQQLLLRSPIVAVQLEGNVVAPNPLPGGLHELILSKTFCGSAAELPSTLHSFKAAVQHIETIVATQSVLQSLPSGLQCLRLNYLTPRTTYGTRDWMVAEFPALSNLIVLRLRGVDWGTTSLPVRLQELCLDGCKVSTELQLPATLRKLELLRCSSSIGDDESFSVQLFEGLQHVVIRAWYNVDVGSELPSTLTHLVLQDRSTSSLGVLPAGLLHLELGTRCDEPIGMLPKALQVLKLGDAYTQPLGVLPDTLTMLDTGDSFNSPLGILPQSLKSLHVGVNFTQNWGPCHCSYSTCL
jgi:hypothetical protein